MIRKVLKSSVRAILKPFFGIYLTSTGSDGHRGVYPFDWLVAHQNSTTFAPRKYTDDIEFRYGSC